MSVVCGLKGRLFNLRQKKQDVLKSRLPKRGVKDGQHTTASQEGPHATPLNEVDSVHPGKSIKPLLFYGIQRNTRLYRLPGKHKAAFQENNYSEIKDLGVEAVVRVILVCCKRLSSLSAPGPFFRARLAGLRFCELINLCSRFPEQSPEDTQGKVFTQAFPAFQPGSEEFSAQVRKVFSLVDIAQDRQDPAGEVQL